MSENFKEVHSLMESWRGKENHNVPAEEITRMFNIYNKIMGTREYSKSCGSCRAKVWTGLKNWYDNNKSKYLND
jgi:hypothetical protein